MATTEQVEVEQPPVMLASTPPATTSSTSKAHAWKVPKGGERDRQAICYWAGPFMANSLLANPAANLKHVKKEDIRDGSIPQMSETSLKPDDSNWTDEAHIPDERPELAHMNSPKQGELLKERFPFHFVHPGLFDRKIRIVFEPISDNTTTVEDKQDIYTLDLESFGNQLKKSIDRPKGMEQGSYCRYSSFLRHHTITYSSIHSASIVSDS